MWPGQVEVMWTRPDICLPDTFPSEFLSDVDISGVWNLSGGDWNWLWLADWRCRLAVLIDQSVELRS